jgi:hypothetical protein
VDQHPQAFYISGVFFNAIAGVQAQSMAFSAYEKRWPVSGHSFSRAACEK